MEATKDLNLANLLIDRKPLKDNLKLLQYAKKKNPTDYFWISFGSDLSEGMQDKYKWIKDT